MIYRLIKYSTTIKSQTNRISSGISLKMKQSSSYHHRLAFLLLILIITIRHGTCIQPEQPTNKSELSLAPVQTQSHFHPAKQPRCQEITIPMCKSIQYNYTNMPNSFNHETQVIDYFLNWPRNPNSNQTNPTLTQTII